MNSQYKKHWIKKYKPMNQNRELLLINIGYLHRLQKFRTFLDIESQQLYFTLLDNFKKQYQIAKYLSDGSKQSLDNWNEFLERALFYVPTRDATIMKSQISKRKIEFIRKARAYLRHIDDSMFK